MPRNKHPNKEIEEALKYAADHHWRIENSKGHPFGKMYCPYKDSTEPCEGNGKCAGLVFGVHLVIRVTTLET